MENGFIVFQVSVNHVGNSSIVFNMLMLTAFQHQLGKIPCYTYIGYQLSLLFYKCLFINYITKKTNDFHIYLTTYFYPLNWRRTNITNLFAYRVNYAKPPKSPGGGLDGAIFKFFSPPLGGWGAVFIKKYRFTVLTR